MKTIISAIFCSICLCSSFALPINVDSIFLWGNQPDSIPGIFGKGLISVEDRYEYGVAISPGYDEIFYTVTQPGDGLMVMRKNDNGTWQAPVTANLRRDNSPEQEAFYTPDGKKLFFSSDVNDTTRLWYSVKEKTGWSAAKILESPVNDNWVFWATFTGSNTMYYTNISAFKIYRSDLDDGIYKEVAYSGISFGIHPSVAKDESYILFDYKGDIYVSFKDENDIWMDPVKPGELINTSYTESCPSLSPDERYIFFSRYNDLNGKSDIYRVRSSMIVNSRS